MQKLSFILYLIVTASALPNQQQHHRYHHHHQLSKRADDASNGDIHLPFGQPPLPLTDDHIKAPDIYGSPPTPGDAAVFPVPPTSDEEKQKLEELRKSGALLEFDCAAFDDWTKDIRDGKIVTPASKWIQIAPGNYRYKLGPHVRAEEEDSNLTPGFNLIVYAMKGGWTLDLRGVTFYIDAGPETRLRRGNQMIYTLQSDGLTILGGTVWIDMGELHTQAKLTNLGGDGTAEFEVEEGYDLGTWRKASARNQRCVDVSDEKTFKHVGCNFWQLRLAEENDEDRKNQDRRVDYDFSKLESERTFSGLVTNLPVSKLKEGMILTMIAGRESVPWAMNNEMNSNFVVKGFVTNGGFGSIGTSAGEVAPHYENCYQVNPSPRPGFARRVQGPGLSYANLGGFVYNAPGAAVNTTFDNSFYQSTGNPNDLIPGAQMMEEDPLREKET